MLAIKLIDEPQVAAALNGGRFEGEVEGYVAMDGPAYLGYALFRVAGGVTEVLDTGVDGAALLDGMVRACAAAGQNRGAGMFAVNAGHPPLAEWWRAHCAGKLSPTVTAHLFGGCHR